MRLHRVCIFKNGVLHETKPPPELVTPDRADYVWRMPEPIGKEFAPPTLDVAATWENVAAALASADFEERLLPALLREARWFGGKAHLLRNVRVVEMLTLDDSPAGKTDNE